MPKNEQDDLLQERDALLAEVQRLRGELELQHSWRQGMRDAFDQTDVAILVFSEDGHLRWYNAHAATMFPREHLDEESFDLERFVSTCIPERFCCAEEMPDDYDLVAHISAHCNDPFVEPDLEIKEVSSGEYYRFWAQPFTTQEYGKGRILHMSEITAQKETEHALARNQILLEAIIESLPFDVWVCDQEGRYIIQNPISIQTWGDRRGESLGDLDIDEAVRDEWMEIGARAFHGEIVRMEVTFDHRGETRHFDQIVAPVMMDGEPFGVLGFHLDLAPLKEAERTLELQRQQTQKMESIVRLAGNIARDFERNLEVIHGWATTAAQISTTSEQEKVNKAIFEEVARASQLTRELISLGDGGSGTLDLVGLDALVQEHLPRFRKELSPKTKLTFRSDGLTRLVRADSEQLVHMLEHLIENAALATSPEGKIELSTRKLGLRDQYYREHPWVEPGEWTLVQIKDVGEGMSPEVRARVFEPYFTTYANRQGLGLAIVYSIVQRHQGHISVDSSPGVGTCVDVLLPVVS
jgi:PAS domain S-box-containing protein